jgi:hypothetical protein
MMEISYGEMRVTDQRKRERKTKLIQKVEFFFDCACAGHANFLSCAGPQNLEPFSKTAPTGALFFCKNSSNHLILFLINFLVTKRIVY